ncbi:hypothetical protein [Paenibacillus agricola]|uniref:Uncharacterized protein n=1 Tax=Paenibacillus agricola TaxID=2716264 RepID=A0ABX0J9Y7_9BACL|nr:hypothetical protein [Paenibacillus agricola]NHN33194.1 hypothetical protein [Paenibacillus agricola]
MKAKISLNENLEEMRDLARLQRMIRTANKHAERKEYLHHDIELGTIKRIMEAKSFASVAPGMEQIIGHYYEKMTGRKPYFN